MPATITVKDIPDDVYERLKETAEQNHRSIEREIIECLQKSTQPTRNNPEEILERARRVRFYPSKPHSPEQLCEIINEGRP